MSEERYKVGFGRPPLEKRFKPGQSGNAKGRPKGVKNLKTELEEELGELIGVREGDRTYKISKQRAILKAMIAKAVKGDTRAGLAVLAVRARLIDDEKASGTAGEIAGSDRTLLAEFLDREIAKREKRHKKQNQTIHKEKNDDE